jgi:inosose dehydratase
MSKISRRKFLAGAGTLAAATSASALLKPFESSSDSQAIRLGYAAITWGSDGRKAIEDISAVGFHGIQLRADAVKQFQAAELRDLLRQHALTFVALSSGDLHIDPAQEADDIALHTANAKYVRDAGGLYLQIIDKPPKDRAITAADYKRLGQLLTEVGKRSADVGIPLGYHNHMGTLSQEPQNLDQILDAADPRYVKLELDVAHYVQGGGDPAKAIHKYHDRLLFLHLKDVRDADPNTPGVKGPYQWVELGRGRVDLPGVVKALHEVNFHGWAVVELDRVPDKTGTPKESAEINKKYLEDKLGLKV